MIRILTHSKIIRSNHIRPTPVLLRLADASANPGSCSWPDEPEAGQTYPCNCPCSKPQFCVPWAQGITATAVYMLVRSKSLVVGGQNSS